MTVDEGKRVLLSLYKPGEDELCDAPLVANGALQPVKYGETDISSHHTDKYGPSVRASSLGLSLYDSLSFTLMSAFSLQLCWSNFRAHTPSFQRFENIAAITVNPPIRLLHAVDSNKSTPSRNLCTLQMREQAPAREKSWLQNNIRKFSAQIIYLLLRCVGKNATDYAEERGVARCIMLDEHRSTIWWLKAFLVAFLSLDINLIGKSIYYSYGATSTFALQKNVWLVIWNWRQPNHYYRVTLIIFLQLSWETRVR